jgi:yecA family protein
MIDPTLLTDLEQCLRAIVPEDQHLSSDEIRGLFYAQMITPNKTKPLVWVSALFYGERPKLDEAQVNALNATAAAVHDAYSALFAANKLSFPFDFEQLDETIAEAAYQWCQGFFIGLLINEDFWFGKKSERLTAKDAELTAIRNSAKLFPFMINKDFSVFDKAKIAELKALIISEGQEPSDDMIAVSLFPNVPVAVNTLQAFGTKMMRANAPKTIADAPKLGRNEPCHCGSGKKYKKCCG